MEKFTTNIRLKENNKVIHDFDNAVESSFRERLGMITRGDLALDYVSINNPFTKHSQTYQSDQESKSGIVFRKEGDSKLYTMQVTDTLKFGDATLDEQVYSRCTAFFIPNSNTVIKEVILGSIFRSSGFDRTIATASKDIEVYAGQYYSLEWRIFINGA